MIAHGGKVWLFTARGDFANCSCNTDVWSARLCGPGGATVINVGSTTWIAFHAYVDANHNGVKDSKTRQA
ncbi:hypothetical protein [Kribbella sp. NPDC004536]|uniref:hypothetical protein n=1 Tax=Kribbella sp. NPDC004536 TaxID=3364106 RepID=UPI0036829295